MSGKSVLLCDLLTKKIVLIAKTGTTGDSFLFFLYECPSNFSIRKNLSRKSCVTPTTHFLKKDHTNSQIWEIIINNTNASYSLSFQIDVLIRLSRHKICITLLSTNRKSKKCVVVFSQQVAR
jgi:hypothetical protein